MNAWEELMSAMQRTEAPPGAKTSKQIAKETGCPEPRVREKMRQLVAEGKWDRVRVGQGGGYKYWPKEEKNGTGRDRRG